MASVITDEGVKVQSALHTFIKLLLDKEVAHDGSLARDKTILALTDLKELVLHLLNNPEKITDSKLSIMSVRNVSMLDSKKRKLSLEDDDAPYFEAKSVSKVAHLPYRFLWAFVDKIAKKAIPIDIKSKLSEKSVSSIRIAVNYITGLNPKFGIQGDLLHKATLIQFLIWLANERGNLVDLGNGLFVDLYDSEKQVLDWSKPSSVHGIFVWSKTDKCPDDKVDLVQCRSHGNAVANLGSEIPADTPIHANYSETEAWLSRLAEGNYLLKRYGSTTWHVSLGTICGEIVLAWPVQERTTSIGRSFVLDMAKERVYLPMMVPDDYLAMPYSLMSPLEQALFDADPETCLGKPARVQDSTEYALLPCIFVPDDTEKPLPVACALQCFDRLPMSFLVELADEWAVTAADKSSLVALISSLVRAKVPGISDARLLEVLRKRSIVQMRDADLGDLADVDWVLDVFDKEEKKTVAAEIADSKDKAQEAADWKRAVLDMKATLSGKVAHLSTTNKKHPLHKYKGATSVAHGAMRDMSQSAAKLYAPPGTSLWRNNVEGGWAGHVRPWPRMSEAWSKHSHDSRSALDALLARMWRTWLEDNLLPWSACPVAGLKL